MKRAWNSGSAYKVYVRCFWNILHVRIHHNAVSTLAKTIILMSLCIEYCSLIKGRSFTAIISTCTRRVQKLQLYTCTRIMILTNMYTNIARLRTYHSIKTIKNLESRLVLQDIRFVNYSDGCQLIKISIKSHAENMYVFPCTCKTFDANSCLT